MDVLFVFILSMKFVSFVQSADKPPSVLCGYGGTDSKTSYVFSISDVPDRCEAIAYSYQYFNDEPSATDTTAIKALTAANKIVYTSYTYKSEKDWNGIMNAKDPSVLDNHIAPMIKYLNDNKLNGVILCYLNLLAGNIPDYTNKIKSLICKIKSQVPSIKVGVTLSGYITSDYGNNDLFDFTAINDIVDLYLIDTTIIGNECTATTTAKGGRYPITSNDKSIVTLDIVSKGCKNSPLDQSKILINFADYALKVEKDAGEVAKTYTEYCHRASNELWCGDTMQIFYDGVQHVKENFQGIYLTGLDRDDYDNSCGCGKFSVANTFIDAWLNKPITCCAKI